jgi:hypothetical protein
MTTFNKKFNPHTRKPDYYALPEGAGTGDVVGPASATNENIAIFDGVTGKIIKDGGSKLTDFAAASHDQNASTIIIPDGVGTPSFNDMQDFLQETRSSGRITGGALSAYVAPPTADGIVVISEMEGMIFTTNALGGDFIFFKQAAGTVDLTGLADNTVYWIYFDWNGGTPQYVATADRTTIHEYDHFAIGRVWRSGNTLEVQSTGHNIYNKDRRSHDRLILKYGNMDRVSGSTISKHATALRLQSSAGSWYVANQAFATDAQDTFYVWYKTGGGDWTKSTELTLWSDVFDGGTSTVYNSYQNGTSIGTLSQYGVYWVYQCPEGDLYVVMGDANYVNIVTAQAAAIPTSLPPYCVNWARLVGKVICAKQGAALYTVETVFGNTFTQSSATDHASLGNLDWGSSGHTGTASNLAAFSAAGAAENKAISDFALTGQTFYIGTTQVAINRASDALTLAGITLTTPNIGTPSSGTLTNCAGLPYSGLANGIDGNLITWDADGSVALVATGDAGQVLTSNGAGAAPTFQVNAGGGASTALDNLADVAINTSLISDTDSTDDLGSSTKYWANAYLDKIYLDSDSTIEASDVDGWNALSSGITWTAIDTDGNLTINTGTIANKGTLLTITLPTTAAVGSVIRISGMGAGGWKLAQNASEIIHFGNTDTTTGTDGYLASSHIRDAVELVCCVADTEWNVVSSIGNITIV